MPSKLFSIVGILVACTCLYMATRLYPGDYNWGRDYISTLIRGPAGSSRVLADAAVLFFCLSIALIFVRLARVAEFSKYSGIIRISGIGSQVYTAIIITPMHDLMVTISFVFLFTAVLTLAVALMSIRETRLFFVGCACLAVLVASAAIYYSGYVVALLPWTQKGWLALFAVWLVSLDLRFQGQVKPRLSLSK